MLKSLPFWQQPLHSHYFLPASVMKFPAFWDMAFVSTDALFFIMNTRFYSEQDFNLIEALYSCWKFSFSQLWDFPIVTESLPNSHSISSLFKYGFYQTKSKGSYDR
jgi:hypothetical protein